MFIEHIKSNVQSVMTHPQKPKKLNSAGFIVAKKIIYRKKYGGLKSKPPLFRGHNNLE